jgi:hypothetical protein
VKKPDLGLLLPVSMMLIVVLASWLGIAGPVLKDAEANGLYSLLREWQTLIAALIALGAALLALLPVWRQVTEMQKQSAEMRTQSAMDRYEHLRSREVALAQESELAWQAIAQARYTVDLVRRIRTIDSEPMLEMHQGQVAERIGALDVLNADLARAGLDKWGPLEARESRGQLYLATTALKVELLQIAADLQKLSSLDPYGWAHTDKGLADLEVPAADRLEDKAMVFLQHVKTESVRLGQLTNRLGKELGV